MTRKEWVNRCANRLMKLRGCTWNEAQNLAAACAREQADTNGESGVARQSPEEAADNFSAAYDDAGGD